MVPIPSKLYLLAALFVVQLIMATDTRDICAVILGWTRMLTTLRTPILPCHGYELSNTIDFLQDRRLCRVVHLNARYAVRIRKAGVTVNRT